MDDRRLRGPADAPRVLVLLAFACHPEQGSEPGAGWAALRVAADLYDRVEVITESRDDGRLRARAAELPAEVGVHHVGSARLERSSVYLRYADWVARTRGLILSLRRELGPVDVHHVTYASDWLPTPMTLLRKAPGERWVWGPMGGSTRPPLRLAAALGARQVAFEAVRAVTGAAGRVVNLAVLPRRVDALLVLNRDTARAWRRAPVITRPNAVVDYAELPDPAPRPDRETRVMLFAGRGVDWKGLRLALRAFALLPDEWELHVAGRDTAALVEKEGMTDHPRVILHDKVDRPTALAMIAAADVFVLPSLHDSAPWAAAEAAGVGTPVVCLDLGGVADLAGSLARPVPARPVGTLTRRLADAAVAAADEARAAAPAPDRPWTYRAMREFMEGVYARARTGQGA